MASTSILPASRAGVNSSSCVTAPTQQATPVIPIMATWQLDRDAPGYATCLLQSTEQFGVSVTRHGVETHATMCSDYADGLWSVSIHQLSRYHLVSAWNEQIEQVFSCNVRLVGLQEVGR